MPNPTYHDMAPAIGQRVSVNFESVRVTCQVRNVKSSYGRVRLLVAPESGSGEQWVEVSRLNRPEPHASDCPKLRGYECCCR